MNVARELWIRLETVHAVTYFGDETVQAGQQLGLSGFWAGYFAFRAAPMGAVTAGVVQASFFNFAPQFVERWVPAVWSTADPADCIEARAAAAAATLARLGVGTLPATVRDQLAAAVERCEAGGRPLCAANARLPMPDEPLAALWQRCTVLREHRGDSHVAALTVAGLDGLEAHVLIAAEQGTEPGDLQRTRGWTAPDWSDAVHRCHTRGLVTELGVLTSDGRQLRNEIEATTDRMAIAPWENPGERAAVLEALTPIAEIISRSGLLRYPNPIGLPPL